ncbi:MAG TPA: hypothetical protein VGU20_06660 [Stellaceae bacterium]|nr:hypothetical protein [Stellaceae bacterium]
MIGKLTPVPEQGFIGNKKAHALPGEYDTSLGGAAARNNEVTHRLEVGPDHVADAGVMIDDKEAIKLAHHTSHLYRRECARPLVDLGKSCLSAVDA